jgi:mRNA-degrading endonuclease RelE of RelBE toxin-antitoxin system
MARFALLFSENVKRDLQTLRAYDRRALLDAIETQLAHAPTIATKQRKLLHNLTPPFEAIPPIWQLRVGAFRVFYDVQPEVRLVCVRAVRRKPAHQHTEEIL